jgi:hypothetical protein
MDARRGTSCEHECEVIRLCRVEVASGEDERLDDRECWVIGDGLVTAAFSLDVPLEQQPTGSTLRGTRS